MIIDWEDLQIYKLTAAHLISVLFLQYTKIFFTRSDYKTVAHLQIAHSTIHSTPLANFSPLSQTPVTELVNICNWQREEDDEKTLVTMDHFIKE